jgi:TorA maturation chaperone TorD
METVVDRTLSFPDQTLARALVLRLLSQAFTYPSPAEVDRLVRDDVPLAVCASPHLPETVRTTLDAFAEAVTGTTAGELETHYCAVFTHIHSTDCPMYETDYGQRDVWRQSNTLADIAGFYRAFGFDPVGERPDHAAVELEFLHVLAYKEGWATAHGEEINATVCRDATVAFERDHALGWFPAFAARTEALGGSGPYAVAARLLATVCAAEADRTGLQLPDDLPAAVGAAGADDDPPSLCEVEG